MRKTAITEPISRKPGDHFGSTNRSYEHPDFRISETRYAPAAIIPFHEHQHAALCFILSGRYDETYGRRTVEHGPGTLVLHPAGERHANRHHEAPVRLLVAELQPEYLSAMQDRLPVLIEPECRSGLGLIEGGRRIAGELLRADDVSPLAIEEAILASMAEVVRQRDGDRRAVAPWMLRIEDRIHSCFREKITLADLAGIAEVHPMHLVRAFRLRHGCTIGDYQRRLRIDAACHDLEDSGTPLAGLAAVLAATSLAACGSPSRYRRLSRSA